MKEVCSKHIVNDTGIYIVEKGEGYPVFVIHGGPGLDHNYFGNYQDALCDEFKLIFVDLRGHGQSDAVPPESQSIEKHSDDIYELAKVLGINEYAVYGHSYGAFVALKNAIDYPNSASHIILSGGSPSSTFLLDNFIHLNEIIELDKNRDTNIQLVNHEGCDNDSITSSEKFKKDFLNILPYYFYDREDSRILEFNKFLDKTIYSVENNIQFSEDLGGFDYCEELKEIEVPVLILVGDCDYITPPKDSIYMKENIKNSELVVFKNAGHFMFVEQQEEYCETIRKFLKS